VSTLDWLAVVLVVALGVYLVIALLRPEDFQ
jgi:K+-transporting ATPase KdpF subunit